MMAANARRYVVALVLVGMAGYFDYRVKGQLLGTLVLVGLAVAALLFAPIVQPVARDMFGWIIPERYRALLAAAVPAAFLYITRWSGTQSSWTALMVVGVPILLGLLGIRNRGRLDQLVTPLARARNRVLPRWARVVLAIAIPLILSFWFVHGSLADIGALVGRPTQSPTMVNSSGIGLRMVIATSLSAVLAYFLMTEPRPGSDG